MNGYVLFKADTVLKAVQTFPRFGGVCTGKCHWNPSRQIPIIWSNSVTVFHYLGLHFKSWLLTGVDELNVGGSLVAKQYVRHNMSIHIVVELCGKIKSQTARLAFHNFR
jgi:hypothetical protein